MLFYSQGGIPITEEFSCELIPVDSVTVTDMLVINDLIVLISILCHTPGRVYSTSLSLSLSLLQPRLGTIGENCIVLYMCDCET